MSFSENVKDFIFDHDQVMNITSIRYKLIETIDPLHVKKIQRKLSEIKKKKPIKINIIDETSKGSGQIISLKKIQAINESGALINKDEEFQRRDNKSSPVSPFNLEVLQEEDYISSVSEKKSPKKQTNIQITALHQNQQEAAFRSNSENMLGKEKIDNFNPFIDNYLGLTSDQNECPASDSNSNSSPPLRLNSQDVHASTRQVLDGTQQDFLSPTKMGKVNLFNKSQKNSASYNNYQSSQNFSPQSSCISSFFIDRIDELLPEKKLVTEKLFKGKDQNGQGGPGGFGQIYQDDTPQQKFQDPLNRPRQPAAFKQRFFNSKYLTTFQQKIEFLKYQLQFSSIKEFEKDQHKKQKAQGLKFLRKLGLKLRKPATVLKSRQYGQKRQSDGQTSFHNLYESPIKSVFLMGSPEVKISPRQALLRQQQINQMQEKRDLENQDGFQGFQLHHTGGSEENNSSCGNSSAKYRDLFKGNNQSEVPIKNLKNEDGGEMTPKLSPSFEITPTVQEIDRQIQQENDQTKNPYDMQWTVSFNPYSKIDAINELLEMQSPIATRNEIRPELDELEAYFMDAFDEFRQDTIYYEFKNYKNYYQEALQQSIQQSLGPFQNNAFMMNNRDRDSSVSFKDKRFFIQSSNQPHSGDNSRRGSVTQFQLPPQLQTQIQLDTLKIKQKILQKQISIESVNPFERSDSRQILEEDEGKENDSPKCSLKNSRRKSQLSPIQQKAMNLNLKILDQLTDMQQTNPQCSKNQSGLSNQMYLNTDGCDEFKENDSPSGVELGTKRRSHTVVRVYDPVNTSALNRSQVDQINTFNLLTNQQQNRKSRSRKRCTTKFNATPQQDKYYLDPNALKQMSKNLKLLCDDILEIKSATVNNKKQRQPTQTKGQQKVKGGQAKFLQVQNQGADLQRNISFQSNQSNSQQNSTNPQVTKDPNRSFTFIEEQLLNQSNMPNVLFNNNPNFVPHHAPHSQNQGMQSLLSSSSTPMTELANSYNRGIQYVMRKYQSTAATHKHQSHQVQKLSQITNSSPKNKRSPNNGRKTVKIEDSQKCIQLINQK